MDQLELKAKRDELIWERTRVYNKIDVIKKELESNQRYLENVEEELRYVYGQMD